MQIKEIMSQRLQRVQGDASVAGAASLMDRHDIGCLAVAKDKEEQIIGTLTDRDIVIRAIAAEKDPKTTSVSEIMTANPVFCQADESVEQVAQRMKAGKIRRIIVKDESGQPVGMVSLGDLAARAHSDELAGQVMEEVCSAP